MLLATIGAPDVPSTSQLIETNGVSIYISSSLSIDKYEQIDVWITRRYWFIVKIRARITLYKRLTN
jgi:hypothetical protein